MAEEMVGTLHAHCYRALGCPELAETKIKEWNEHKPSLALTHTAKGGVDDPNDTSVKGDDLGDGCLSRLNICRASLSPIEAENEKVQAFAKHWTEWKEGNGLMDFTDLIEACIDEGGKHPSDPSIMLGDEAQDWSRLEFKLFCDTWGKHADTVVLSGDFDQTLYTWRGADSQYFRDNPVPEGNLKVLSQSYRVPVAVHDKAHAWIKTATDRMDVDYKPTDQQGVVRRIKENMRDPELIIRDISDNISAGRSVMALVTCSYMLSNLIKLLKDSGIPFGNPLRPANAAWNPLARKKNARMAVNRVEAFISPKVTGKPIWDKEEFITWAGVLRAKDTFRHGVKQILRDPEYHIPPGIGALNELFRTVEDTEEAIMMNTAWFRSRLLPKHEKTVGYVLDVLEKYGEEHIAKRPLLTVGTIHSVKGAEADVVYLFPDLSYQGKESYESEGERKNSVIRTFYVGMTRAKEELVICDPVSNLNVEI